MGFVSTKPWFFLVFQQKSKKNKVFFGFSPETQQKNQKNPVFFWFSNRNPKKHKVFLVFRQKPSRKTKKTLCFFGFPAKIQKKHGFFRAKPKKPKKTLGKPKNPKVSGPSQRLWIFGFLVFWFPSSYRMVSLNVSCC